MEELMKDHILRLEKLIKERENSAYNDGTPCNPWHAELTKVDLKNIASLREGRIPQYRDHGPGLPEIEMFEFSDLCMTE